MAEIRVKETGTIKLFESDNTSSVTIASPASLGADRTITLPDADVTLVSGTMSTGFAVTDITGQTALGATPADTDEFVLSDAGVLKRVDYSYLKSANTPAFGVYMSGNVYATSDTWTRVGWDSEYFDTNSAFASGKFTVPSGEGGKYVFIAGGLIENLADGKFAEIAIYKNGALTSNRQRSTRFVSVAGGDGYINKTWIDVAVATDYFEVYVFNGDDDDHYFENGSQYFFGYKLIGV